MLALVLAQCSRPPVTAAPAPLLLLSPVCPLGSCPCQALYNFIGAVEVLQPSLSCSFVLPDENHMMLPEGAALYKLKAPSCPLPAQHQPAVSLPSAREELAAAHGSDGGAGNTGSSEYCEGEQHKPRKGLGSLSFGSLTGLAQLGSMSLSGALADLTNSFPLFGGSSSSSRGGSNSGGGGSSDEGASGSGGIVAVPVVAAMEAAGIAALDAAFGSELAQLPLDAEAAAAVSRAAAAAAAEVGAAAAAAAAAASKVQGSWQGATPASAGCGDLSLTLEDAILTFMNTPHPLDTLGEMRAYGPAGSISRFHNPNSYTLALQDLCDRQQ
jgi:hypothetical protein